MTTLSELASRIASRDTPRTEATLQADIRQLLMDDRLGLTDAVLLESQAGECRRIDVEVGSTIIEVKKDLRNPNTLREAQDQLRGCVLARERAHERRYVGVLTDGAEWHCYHLRHEELHEAGEPLQVSPSRPDLNELLIWLEGVLATARDIKPTPDEIRARLGVGSSAHALDRSSLADLYEEHRDNPVVRTKRHLWARLLTTALGTQFEDSDDLFVEHTLLVNTAEIIAHAVLGLSPETVAPRSLLSGAKFDEAGVHGVVESDFFDWVVDVPRGDMFVRTLARRVARFDWRSVEHDVLKILYESVIAKETRKKLGEYYTPDWLAEVIVETAVPEPLATRALDPACGSGTFLFHLVRRYLDAAGREGRPVAEQLEGVCRSVLGMDLHPVAVTLARVTYLLAIGAERLALDRDPIRVPVFLGDSMQWGKARPSLWSAHELQIPVDDRRELTPSAFTFPQALLSDPRKFDDLVSQMADLAARPRKPGARPSLSALFQRLAIPPDAQATLTSTFHLMCRLHDEGRDHIWGYYIRNLARPEWLGRAENQVDVLVGNPPWLAFRHMPEEMQAEFRELSSRRGLWKGKKFATNQDLSALFVVRAVELYLRRDAGSFAFVMPSAVLDRGQYEGFRSGNYAGADDQIELRAELQPPWDLRKVRPHFFPISSSVVFGRRSSRAVPMPPAGECWSGKLPVTNASWAEVKSLLKRESSVTDRDEVRHRSPYHPRFRQGATIVPRVLFMVEPVAAGPLGQVRNRVAVRSARSANEKAPWKSLPALEGVVESEFLFQVHLGETILPYRVQAPLQAVLPIDRKGMLGESRIDEYPGFCAWWSEVKEIWDTNRSSERLTILEQLDYHAKLSAQLPVAGERVVYTKSGMHLAAARVVDRRAIIDHTLYWAAVGSSDEGHFLCALLNAAVVTERVRPLMSYGKDERHIDKFIWALPIPLFDPANPTHVRLARLGGEAEELVAGLLLEAKHFATQRRMVRETLAASPVGKAIESAVAELLDGYRDSRSVAESASAGQRIRQFLEAGQVEAARLLAKGTAWEHLLAAPTAKVANTATATGDLPQNILWIAENAARYESRWVALKDGELIADGDSYERLEEVVRDHPDRTVLTITKVRR